jgi:transcriptional regulator with XRE-family HTH domain
MLRRFGAELRRCRLQAGISQMQLANRSGVAQSTISRLERGRVPGASMSKLVQLSDVLGRYLPFGYCPHNHVCTWDRLDADGRPVEPIVILEHEPWLRFDRRET